MSALNCISKTYSKNVLLERETPETTKSRKKDGCLLRLKLLKLKQILSYLKFC